MPRYNNDRRDTPGFVDLGTYREYDLYCFPEPGENTWAIGAKYADEGSAYISASVFRNGYSGGTLPLEDGSDYPPVVALNRMVDRGLLVMPKLAVPVEDSELRPAELSLKALRVECAEVDEQGRVEEHRLSGHEAVRMLISGRWQRTQGRRVEFERTAPDGKVQGALWAERMYLEGRFLRELSMKQVNDLMGNLGEKAQMHAQRELESVGPSR